MSITLEAGASRDETSKNIQTKLLDGGIPKVELDDGTALEGESINSYTSIGSMRTLQCYFWPGMIEL